MIGVALGQLAVCVGLCGVVYQLKRIVKLLEKPHDRP